MSDPTVHAEQQEIVDCSASEYKVPAQEGDVIIHADIHLQPGDSTVEDKIRLVNQVALV